MNAGHSVWEQELYNEFEYKNKEELFHCFEGDTSVIGLSFMDPEEANDFNEKVQERIEKRRALLKRRTRVANSAPQTPTGAKSTSYVQSRVAPPSKECGEDSKTLSWSLFRGKKNKKNKQKLTISRITAPDPASFAHCQGLNVGPGGFEMVGNFKNMDPRIKEFMKMSGIDEKLLADPKKLKRATEFFKNNDIPGIMDQAKKPKKPSDPSPPSEPPTLGGIPTPPPPTDLPLPPSATPTTGGIPPPPPPIDLPPPPPLPSALAPMPTLVKRRPNVLEEIKVGTTLKPLQDIDSRQADILDKDDRNLDDVMRDALDRFRNDICSSDDGNDDDGDSEDDWDSDWD